MKVTSFFYIYIMTLSRHIFQSFAKRFHSLPHIQTSIHKRTLGFIKDVSCRPDFFSSLQTHRYPMNPAIHTKEKKSKLFMSTNNDETSWMEKNNLNNESQVKSTSFHDNFRGTRVFVQGIPKHISWQTLKDHFQIAGNVVFASISIDRNTNQSKGHGIVQFETVEEAKNAIQIMRHHPIESDGTGVLYVRPDHQESSSYGSSYESKKSYQQRSLWKCANDSEDDLTMEEKTMILQIIKARDASRKRKNYDASDAMREQLKIEYNVHLDDRLKLWWKELDGSSSVPNRLNEIKGDGHWKKKEQDPWRQLRTTPEKDSCVDSNLVNALLQQRDIARLEKDFTTADHLLEEATYSPNVDGFILRIHDASRTWRVWSEEAPQKKVRVNNEYSNQMDPVQACLELVQKYDPDKTMEIKTLLKKFPGREYNILKKLKQRYIEYQ